MIQNDTWYVYDDPTSKYQRNISLRLRAAEAAEAVLLGSRLNWKLHPHSHIDSNIIFVFFLFSVLSFELYKLLLKKASLTQFTREQNGRTVALDSILPASNNVEIH